MPTAQQHSQQVKRFEGCFNDPHILQNYPEWAVTAVFYAALHAIDTWLAHVPPPPPVPGTYRFSMSSSSQTHPASHGERRVALDHWFNQGVLSDDVYRAYQKLKDYSENARYRCHVISSARVQSLAANELATVRAFVNSQLTAHGNSLSV